MAKQKRKTILRKLVCIIGILIVNTTLWGQGKEKTLFMISNSHLDTQWNWNAKTTISEYVGNTLRDNMALLDKYPFFQFNFEGAIKYMWMKEYYPTEYEAMKQYIKDGRWHVSGMSVDANDVMISSAESILHSMLYGNKFYQKELGVRGGYDIMLPDCFGFSYALPSLARHAGIKGFHSAKLAWGSAAYSQLPPFGIWQGVDGSQIYAIYKPGAYDSHEEFNKDLTNDQNTLATINQNEQRYGVPISVRYVGNRGDRGGALRDDTSSDQENTPYWLNYNASKKDGAIKVKLATPDEIFDYLETHKNDKYHVWNDELPMKTHGVGSYTSWGLLKRWNRKNELLADAAEKASSVAQWLNLRPYPSEELKDAWVRTIWQQHHDGITGTSILSANDYSYNEYYMANLAFANELKNATGAVAQHLDTQTEGIPMVIHNPLSHERHDVVEAKINCQTRPAGIRVFGPDGQEVLSQITAFDEQQNLLSIIFEATVPSLGYAVYEVRLGQMSELSSTLNVNADTRTINNGRYEVTLSSGGDIQKVFDTKYRRTLMSTVKLQTIYDHEDVWPAWEISYTDVCRIPSNLNSPAEITLVEDGPLRKSYRVKREKDGSTFIQYIRMNALSDRIDCVNEIDWHTPQRMLKVNFPFGFSNEKVTYDISLGTIQRGVRTSDHYEMQGHQWADQSALGGRYGVSILNDCKYGWDKPNNNTLRLTLLHTPSCTNYNHQANMDLGPNHFTYSIFPHEGDWSEETQMEAARLNQPLTAFVAPRHEGALGKKVDFVSLSTNGVSIKALKKAEDTDELIVRVYEWTGKDQNDVKIYFPAPILSAHEVNALEEHVGDVAFNGDSLSFDITPYQPRTFAVRLASKPSLETSDEGGTPQEINYNVDLMSYDSNRGNSAGLYQYGYPADLIPDILMVDGVKFQMGPREDGSSNALRISSQTLNISPKEGENKLYLLMASAQEDGTKATISIDGQDTTFTVPYFSGMMALPPTATVIEPVYRDDRIAFTSSHAHKVSDRSNSVMTQMYIYKYCIPLKPGATQVTLQSSNSRLFLFAATTSGTQIDAIQEATPLVTKIEYEETAMEETSDRLIPRIVNASHQINNNETGAMANDQDPTTKWCVGGSQSETPYLEYFFSKEVIIDKWIVLGAARESGDYVASAFKLQYRDPNGIWTDVDNVSNNTINLVSRPLDTPVRTRRVRLQMVKGEQKGTTTRIYEFAVYGRYADEDAIALPKQDVGENGNMWYDLHGKPVQAGFKGIKVSKNTKVLVE